MPASEKYKLWIETKIFYHEGSISSSFKIPRLERWSSLVGIVTRTKLCVNFWKKTLIFLSGKKFFFIFWTLFFFLLYYQQQINRLVWKNFKSITIVLLGWLVGPEFRKFVLRNIDMAPWPFCKILVHAVFFLKSPTDSMPFSMRFFQIILLLLKIEN